MAEREPVAWFTANGRRIPIFEGQSKDDAWKEHQVRWNEREKERMNAEHRDKPKKKFLPDIPAETANKTSDILNLATHDRFTFKKGTKIKHILVFAGSGTSTEFRDAAKYARRYGGKAEDWQHCAGDALITNGKVTLHREVHWIQHKDGGVKEAFIKVRH